SKDLVEPSSRCERRRRLPAFYKRLRVRSPTAPDRVDRARTEPPRARTTDRPAARRLPRRRVRLPSKSGVLVALAILVLAALAAAWKWTDLAAWADPEAITDRLEPLRAHWYGLPIVVLVFVVAELLLFP